MTKRTVSIRMYFSAVFALTGAMAMGCVIAWCGIVIELLKDTNENVGGVFQNATRNNLVFDDGELLYWITSGVFVGGLGGSLLAVIAIQIAGKRKSLIGSGFIMVLGWACICFIRNFTLTLIGSFLVGFYVGLISVVTPAYIIDIATPQTRGFLGACFLIAICLGELFEECFGLLLKWNRLPFVNIVPPIVCSVGMIFVGSESPIEAYEKKNPNILQILSSIRTVESDIGEELKEIELKVRSKIENTKHFVPNLKRPDIYKPAMIAVLLMTFQHLSGLSTFILDWRNISKTFQNLNANLGLIILGLAHIAASIHAAIVMNKFDRKIMLITSGIGHVVALSLMGYYYSTFVQSNYSWIPIVCIFSFVIAYSVGFGPIPWMIVGDLTPYEAIPFVCTLVSITNWLFASLVTKYGEFLNQILQKHGTYWLFSGISFLSTLYTLFCIPQTKNCKFEDVQRYFRNK